MTRLQSEFGEVCCTEKHPRYLVKNYIRNSAIDVSIKDLIHKVFVHRHEFYEIELILDGSGVYNIDGIDYRIEAGSLFMLSPISFHKIRFERSTKIINIMFTADVCDIDFLSKIFALQPHVVCSVSQEDLEFFHVLAKDLSAGLYDDSAEESYSRAVLNCMLGKICRCAHIASPSGKISSLQYAILYIQNHFTESITLEETAKAANYSPNYFSSQFRDYTGMIFKQYLTDLRFSFAKKLMEHTDIAVTQVCEQCGFGDFSHFMSEFREKYGTTPKKYRKSLEIS